jgi:hypothetical protein
MTQTIYLEPNMVPAQLRGSYSGKTFKAKVCETVTIPASAGLWEGGSRDTYKAIDFETGNEVLVSSDAAPWDRSRAENTVTLSPRFCVVEHTIFCGKDMGLTFYVHPESAAKLLPVPAADLSAYEKLVLIATRSLKSSYGGRDRYEMAQTEYDCKQALNGTVFPSRTQWDETKQSLISKGLLNKAGAITTAGRNAVPSRY